MGQYFFHSSCNHGIIAFLQYLRPETRSVHTVYFNNPVLNFRFTVHGAVDCQITSLGMSSHIKRPVQSGSHCIQVLHAVSLTGHGGQKCHIKIFLPAHNGFIRPPESHIKSSVLQQESDCRKLCLPFLFDNVHVTVHFHIPVSFSRQHGGDQLPIHLLVAFVGKKLFVIGVRFQVFQLDGRQIFLHSRHHTVKFQIRKLTQRQAVHFIHRNIPKRDIPIFL